MSTAAIKSFVKKIPILSGVARALYRAWLKRSFRSSASYWEQRYASGGNSGDGSYGPLAQFKADFLNAFITRTGARTFIEFGCGDGNQLGMIAYPAYIGLDISPTAIDHNRARYRGDASRQFFVFDPATHRHNPALTGSQVALSLDVIFHLTEDATFHTYMENLFLSASDYVVIYSSDTDDPIYPSLPHVRPRAFSKWVSAFAPQWRLLERTPNPHPFDPATQQGSHSDFFVYTKAPA